MMKKVTDPRHKDEIPDLPLETRATKRRDAQARAAAEADAQTVWWLLFLKKNRGPIDREFFKILGGFLDGIGLFGFWFNRFNHGFL